MQDIKKEPVLDIKFANEDCALLTNILKHLIKRVSLHQVEIYWRNIADNTEAISIR